MNLQNLLQTTNELKKEKALAIQKANEIIEQKQTNFLLCPTDSNKNDLIRALNDKVHILNYYNEILI